jgi:hypothetical protein
MNKIQCKNRYKTATTSAEKGILTGRDISAITRHQLKISCLEEAGWEKEPLYSLSLKLMTLAQMAYN